MSYSITGAKMGEKEGRPSRGKPDPEGESKRAELIEAKEFLRPAKGTTLDLYMLMLDNLKRTSDAYQDLDLSRARQEIAHTEELNKIFNAHLATILADERDHRRELLGDRNKRYAYDTAFLYEIHPQEALGLSMIMRQFYGSPEFLELLADYLKKKAEEAK